MNTYVCSDLHGQGWAWDKIKNFLKPEDKLIFLGDAIDRGPDGIRIMTEILKRPNTVYLLGNHEDMMIKAISTGLYHSWFCNGGAVTLESFIALPEEQKNWLMAQLKTHCIYTYEYERADGEIFLFSHSGYISDVEIEKHDILWDRSHFYTSYWEYGNKVTLIHGHTPISHLYEAASEYSDLWSDNPAMMPEPPLRGVYRYCGGHKIDVDCGVHFTGYTILYNIDTDEEILIEEI